MTPDDEDRESCHQAGRDDPQSRGEADLRPETVVRKDLWVELTHTPSALDERRGTYNAGIFQ